jgi:hypothetical protein
MAQAAGTPGPPNPPLRIPDILDEAALTHQMTIRLPGTPADGRPPTAQLSQTIIWVDHGDEVLVHLDSVRTKLLNNHLLVSVDLETDQTGRSPLIVVLAFAASITDPAGLVATTDEYPRGHGQLAARWGRPLQAAVWASVISLAQDHAAERNLAPQTIAVTTGALRFQAGAPFRFASTTGAKPR